MFYISSILQLIGNISLGLGGLFLAFYSLPSDENHKNLRHKIVIRLRIAAALLLLLLAIMSSYTYEYSMSNMKLSYSNLSEHQNKSLTNCVKKNYLSKIRTTSIKSILYIIYGYPNKLLEDYENNIIFCTEEQSNEKLPENFGEMDIELGNPIKIASGRFFGTLLSATVLFIIFLLSGNTLESTVREKETENKLVFWFTMLITGFSIQILLQGLNGIPT